MFIEAVFTEPGALGIELVAGGDDGDGPPTVRSVFVDGLAATMCHPSLRPGCVLIAVNGQSLANCSHEEAMGWLRSAAQLTRSAARPLALEFWDMTACQAGEKEAPTSRPSPRRGRRDSGGGAPGAQGEGVGAFELVFTTAGALGLEFVSGDSMGAEFAGRPAVVRSIFANGLAAAIDNPFIRPGCALLAVDGRQVGSLQHEHALDRLRQAAQLDRTRARPLVLQLALAPHLPTRAQSPTRRARGMPGLDGDGGSPMVFERLPSVAANAERHAANREAWREQAQQAQETAELLEAKLAAERTAAATGHDGGAVQQALVASELVNEAADRANRLLLLQEHFAAKELAECRQTPHILDHSRELVRHWVVFTAL